jgi:hypothetical protein
MATVVRDRIFYKSSGGGMTVSGGECASQPKFTLALLRAAKEKEITRAIETCGFGSAEFYREAAELGTLFLYDLKEMDDAKHRELTGVSNEKIIENLLMLMDMGARIHVRMPLVPGVNDSDEELSALAEENTRHLLPFSFMTLAELMNRFGPAKEGIPLRESGQETDSADLPVYALTNRSCSYGAYWITVPELMKKICGRLEDDAYILPSSVHECMIVPAGRHEDPRELAAMVRSINRECVEEQEVLADCVYRCSRESGILEICA